MEILFSRACPVGSEVEFVKDAIESGKLSGNGKYSKLCEQVLTDYYGTPVLLVTSCTHALEMIALLLEIKPGDKVIMPSYTFVSTANAFILRGATINFVDVDINGNLDIEQLKKVIDGNTKVIVNVHYAGWSCNPEQLREICDSYGTILVEDAAQSLGSTFKGRPLGTFGDLSALSFHDTKNIVAGEGGALIINNTLYLEKANYIREKGTNRMQFSMGLIDKYTWVYKGSSYEMPELSAAYLYAQLGKIREITEKRLRIWNGYYKELSHIKGVRCLEPGPHIEGNGHLFGLIFETSEVRDEFIGYMKEAGIITPFHYIPLHTSPYHKSIANQVITLENTTRISRCIARLPIHLEMSEKDINFVIAKIKSFLRSRYEC